MGEPAALERLEVDLRDELAFGDFAQHRVDRLLADAGLDERTHALVDLLDAERAHVHERRDARNALLGLFEKFEVHV